MADLSIIYSKTGKGLRARNAANADLSTQQLKLLAFINGKSKADEILNQSDTFTEKELAASLSQLETNGFIRPLAAAQSTVEDWGLTSNFTPMVVEEFKNEDEIEAKALAKAATKVAQEKQDAERIAAEKANEKIRWMAEINARKAAEAKHKAEEKSKAAAKEKARLAQERLVREAGCEAYMSKPIQMSAFINEVKKLTGPRTAIPGRGAPPSSTPPRSAAR